MACTECSMSLLDRRYVLVGGREELIHRVSSLVTEQHSKSVPLNLNKPYVVLGKVGHKHPDESSSR